MSQPDLSQYLSVASVGYSVVKIVKERGVIGNDRHVVQGKQGVGTVLPLPSWPPHGTSAGHQWVPSHAQSPPLSLIAVL